MCIIRRSFYRPQKRQSVTEVDSVHLKAGKAQLPWTAFHFSQEDREVETKSIVGDKNYLWVKFTNELQLHSCTDLDGKKSLWLY